MKKGIVYLVGAGPGDPGLLTLRGLRCLERADVVIYDYLANPRLLDFAPTSAQRILVGKHGGGQRTEQSVINQLLLHHAGEGKIVVRLKGGDPFVFGRGGEEAMILHEAGIAVEVVPGVSAAIAVPAYAGIPLTHRALASTVVFTTGYEDPSKAEPAVQWVDLARSGSTIVLLMTTRQLKANVDRLIDAGMDPSTPAAIIEWGTRAEQRTVDATLETIAAAAADAAIGPPAITVIGKVVSLREKLKWFERKPLFGRRIVLTRPRHQSAGFAQQLEDLGAEVLALPAIEIEVNEGITKLDAAMQRASDWDWLIFTSANGVKVFIDRLRHVGADIREFHRARIAAIGPQTASALRELYIEVAVVPGEFRAEGLLEAMASEGVSGQRILLPRAAGAREVLPDQLRAMGALVEEIETYRAVPAAQPTDEVARLAEQGRLDLVTFTSSSTVRSFVDAFRNQIDLGKLTVGCIGPITADTARESGMTVTVQPESYTMPSFVDAIVQHFAPKAAN